MFQGKGRKAILLTLVFMVCVLILSSIFIIFLQGSEDKNLLDSYNSSCMDKNLTILIGESVLLTSKNRTKNPSLVDKILRNKYISKVSPINLSTTKERLEDFIFGSTSLDVSDARIIFLRNGNIKSRKIGNELIVHDIEKAGKESIYDFYAGTHDNGLLIGGFLENMSYKIIDKIDTRIRELEVADINNDGINEVLGVTHYDGMTVIYYPQRGWEKKVIDKNEYGKNNTFNHKVEVADLDSDGTNEIVTTPSQPNSWDESQRGVIRIFDRVNGTWQSYKSDELDRGHIRKIVLYPEENAIFGGVGQRNKPEFRQTSVIKYRFVDGSPRKVNETFCSEAKHNFYPFLVKNQLKDYVVLLASNGIACGVDPDTMERVFVDRFSNTFEAFYTAEVFDYNSDGKEELLIVQDGKVSIYSVSNNGLKEVNSIDVYKDFSSSIVWTVKYLRK